MPTSVLRPALGLFLALACSGCYTIDHAYDGTREITPGTKLTAPSESLGVVRGSKKATFLFFGLVPLNDGSGPQLAEDLAVEAYGRDFDGITRLDVRSQAGVLDVIVNALVGIVFSMETVEVAGEVHRHEAGGAR